MTSPIPHDLSFSQAAVLPLAVSTAASGLFQRDHLALALPTVPWVSREETVLVWGGSTSVGANAIQLARNSGYHVIATSSPRNFGFLRSLGAEGVADYHAKDAVDYIATLVGDSPLAGVLAIGRGSMRPALELAGRLPGSRRVAAAQPAVLVAAQGRVARRHGVQLTAIWGGSLKNNEVGPAIYVDFLPGALQTGEFRAVPEALVVAEGLDKISDGLRRLKEGVSAAKIVVTI